MSAASLIYRALPYIGLAIFVAMWFYVKDFSTWFKVVFGISILGAFYIVPGVATTCNDEGGCIYGTTIFALLSMPFQFLFPPLLVVSTPGVLIICEMIGLTNLYSAYTSGKSTQTIAAAISENMLGGKRKR